PTTLARGPTIPAITRPTALIIRSITSRPATLTRGPTNPTITRPDAPIIRGSRPAAPARGPTSPTISRRAILTRDPTATTINRTTMNSTRPTGTAIRDPAVIRPTASVVVRRAVRRRPSIIGRAGRTTLRGLVEVVRVARGGGKARAGPAHLALARWLRQTSAS